MWLSSPCTLSTATSSEKIVREVQSMRPRFQRLTLGAPLLSGHGDYVQLMQALRQQMPPLAATERVVFMGHGASHHAFGGLRLSGSYDGGAGFSGAGGGGGKLSRSGHRH